MAPAVIPSRNNIRVPSTALDQNREHGGRRLLSGGRGGQREHSTLQGFQCRNRRTYNRKRREEGSVVPAYRFSCNRRAAVCSGRLCTECELHSCGTQTLGVSAAPATGRPEVRQRALGTLADRRLC